MDARDSSCPSLHDQIADAKYAVIAWGQSVAWLTALGGFGTACTGFAHADTVMFASGVTIVVTAFLPRARPLWVYSVAQTWAMRQGWTAIPASERPLRVRVSDKEGREISGLRPPPPPASPAPPPAPPARVLHEHRFGPDVIRYPELPERERGN